MKDFVRYVLENTAIRFNVINESASEEDKKAQQERSKKYGISVKEGGNVTKPKEYSDVPDEDFGDPVNYKYPIDASRILPAIRYFNHEDMMAKGGYNPEEWAIIGKRIAKKASELLKAEYVYEDGKVKKVEE